VKCVTTKSGASQFGEISGGNSMVLERPSGGNPIDAARAIENNKGFVYASVNAKAREVMAGFAISFAVTYFGPLRGKFNTSRLR